MSVVTDIFDYLSGNYAAKKKRKSFFNALERIDQDIEKIKGQLVPSPPEELDLISAKIDIIRKSWLKYGRSLRMYNIYNEELFCAVVEREKQAYNEFIYFVRGVPNSYYYWLQEDKVELWIDQTQLGWLLMDGRLMSSKSGKLLALLKYDPDHNEVMIFLDGKNKASFKLRTKTKKTTERFFSMVHPANRAEALIIESIGLFFLVRDKDEFKFKLS